MKKLLLMSLLILSVLGIYGQNPQYTLPISLPLGSEDTVNLYAERTVVYGFGAIQNSNWTRSFPPETIKLPVPRSAGESINDLVQRIALMEAHKAVTNITDFNQTFRVAVFLSDSSDASLFHTINPNEEIVFVNGINGYEVPSSVNVTYVRQSPTRLPVHIPGIQSARLVVNDEFSGVFFDEMAPTITSATDRDWGIRKTKNRLLLPMEYIAQGYEGEVTITLKDGQIGVYDLRTGKRKFPPIPLKQEVKFENGNIITTVSGAPGLFVRIEVFETIDEMIQTNSHPTVYDYLVLDRDGKGSFTSRADGPARFSRIVAGDD